mmetsp:Transcript_25118/g.51784  ORF Transcript_25118/g.51784 Transcript_25118/m.51784 type:complete len:186 (+) Transcript_25118:210-767(+)
MTSIEVKVRLELSLFIKRVVQAMPQPQAFSILGDCASSLCLLTLLPMEECAELLKAANLITMKKKTFGVYIFETSKDVWNDFLQFHGLWEWDQMGIAESTKAKIKIQSLKKLSPGKPNDPKRGWVHLIRIGKCKAGETVTPSLQFNDGVVLPDITLHLRQAQRALKVAIKPHINQLLGTREIIEL